MKRTLIVAGLVAGVLLSGATPAAATEPLGKRVYDRIVATPYSQRDELWSSLPHYKRAAYKEWVRPVPGGIGGGSGAPGTGSVVQSGIGGADGAPGSGCWTWTRGVTAQNVFGWSVWTYEQQLDWCSDGASLYQTFRKRMGDVHMVLWAFEGHRDGTVSGGDGASYWRAYTQGAFEVCVVQGVGCVKWDYPWIDSTVWADGRYTSEESNGG